MDARANRISSYKLWKVIMPFVLLIAFFLAIILFYYNMLAHMTENNIARNSELNAISSADRIDNYLAIGIESVDLTGYTVDNMLRERRSQKTILEYFEDQSVAIGSIIPECTNGVYGYIRDEFLDVSGWVPDEDYVPVERPWYTLAVSGGGNTVILDPYIDPMTGDVTITIAKLLYDGKSVVAIDLTMNELQSIVESLPEEDETVFVMSRDYTVICHSDRDEIGKNYSGSKGDFGSSVIRAYQSAGSGSFRVHFGGSEYIVYTVTLDEEWVCVSVTDTARQYRNLRLQMLLTLFSSVIFVSFILFIMIKSSKRQAEAEELERETKSAVLANQAKSAFLANMSHEIRTPINAILGINEMILRESEDADILSYAGSIRSSGRTLLGLVNDILDFSKIESGKITLIPVEYELSSVIYDLYSMIKSRAYEKGLKLIIEADPDMPCRLYGDEVRIKQIMINLLTNAVKYTLEGSVTLGMSFEYCDEEHILLSVCVRDTGIGIRPEDMDRLFMQFERLDEKKNRNIEGTGLGLNITKMLLELMDSELSVKSDYGKGSEFSFTLKQKVVSRQGLGDISFDSEASATDGSSSRESFTAPDAQILVVDDNALNLDVFKGLVKRTLVAVDTATGGDEGLLLAAKKKYDLIFLDHMMPRKDGIETLHELKTGKADKNQATPVVCLTANAISGARKEYLGAGFDDYLTKPIDPDQLERMMMRFLPAEKVTVVEAEAMQVENFDELPRELMALESVGVDVKQGIINNRTKDGYMSVLHLFYKSLDGVCEELKRLYDNEDIPGYTIKIHALKSSVMIIGAAGLGDEAQLLENACKKDDREYLRDHHFGFLEKIVSLKPLLDEVFAGDDETASDREMASAKQMEAACEKMRAAAGEMDCDALEAILNEMEKYCIPKEQTKMWEKLREAVSRFEYDEVLSILNDR